MLIVFDVDGTLISGEEYDWRSFNDAFTEVTGRKFSIEFWKTLDEVTASAIVHEGLSDLSADERNELEGRVRTLCLENLKRERANYPGAFFSTDQTRDLLEMLWEHSEYDVAIATGDWYDTIQYKLSAAGIELDRYTHATSSDTPARSDIISLAAQRSNRPLKECIYVGDGLWDLRACRKLGIPFIGTGERVDELKTAGAEWTVDKLETTTFFDVLKKVLVL